MSLIDVDIINTERVSVSTVPLLAMVALAALLVLWAKRDSRA